MGISIVANAVGAFASLLAGLADRWGRANLVTYGLLITGCLYAFALPHAPTKVWFGVIYAFVGFVEGIVLVATPALSPVPCLADPDGRALPLHPGAGSCWPLFAMSGGSPLTVAGEWTPRGLWPLTAWDDGGRAVPL